MSHVPQPCGCLAPRFCAICPKHTVCAEGLLCSLLCALLEDQMRVRSVLAGETDTAVAVRHSSDVKAEPRGPALPAGACGMSPPQLRAPRGTGWQVPAGRRPTPQSSGQLLDPAPQRWDGAESSGALKQTPRDGFLFASRKGSKRSTAPRPPHSCPPTATTV